MTRGVLEWAVDAAASTGGISRRLLSQLLERRLSLDEPVVEFDGHFIKGARRRFDEPFVEVRRVTRRQAGTVDTDEPILLFRKARHRRTWRLRVERVLLER